MSDEFTIKDSGARQEFAGGMVRDTTEGKIDFLNVRFGPMLRRWAAHLTKGRTKYPDPEPGVPNWTLAEGQEEYLRAKASAARHFEQWLSGEQDEDHASAVFFNINLAEYVLDKAGRRAGWKVVGDKLPSGWEVKPGWPSPIIRRAPRPDLDQATSQQDTRKYSNLPSEPCYPDCRDCGNAGRCLK